MSTVAVRNITRRPTPRFAYAAVAKEALPGWDVSLVFVGPKKARELNEQLREASYVPNVLSYALDDAHGEIIICLAEAKKQAPLHQMDERSFVLFLFIHGLLHLKGWAHGGTMEQCERTLLAQFAPRLSRNPHVATHSDGH
jgi:rRNA maturation RNase YbeY